MCIAWSETAEQQSCAHRWLISIVHTRRVKNRFYDSSCTLHAVKNRVRHSVRIDGFLAWRIKHGVKNHFCDCFCAPSIACASVAFAQCTMQAVKEQFCDDFCAQHGVKHPISHRVRMEGCSACCITRGAKNRFYDCFCTLHGVTHVGGSSAWCITPAGKNQFCDHVHIDGSSA